MQKELSQKLSLPERLTWRTSKARCMINWQV